MTKRCINTNKQKINNIPTIEEIKEVLESCYFTIYREPAAQIALALIKQKGEKFKVKNINEIFENVKNFLTDESELKHIIEDTINKNNTKANATAFNIMKEKLTTKKYTPDVNPKKIWHAIGKDINNFNDHVEWVVTLTELALSQDTFESFAVTPTLNPAEMSYLQNLITMQATSQKPL